MKQKSPIAITNDLDGVHFSSLPPIPLIFNLLTKRWQLPEEEKIIPVYKKPKGLIRITTAKVSYLVHKYAFLKPDGIKTLKRFCEIADKHKKKIELFILSGREKDKHQFTKDILHKAGYSEYISDWYLNHGINAALWKEYQARKLVERGYTVVHLEDDLRAALCVARVNTMKSNPKVIVYLFKNISNHPRLVRRIEDLVLPENIIFVNGFQEALHDFNKRIERGLL